MFAERGVDSYTFSFESIRCQQTNVSIPVPPVDVFKVPNSEHFCHVLLEL